MSDSLFWWYIEKRKRRRIKRKDLEKMEKVFHEKILELARVTKLYFVKDSPESDRFYDRIGDCYDGIYLGSSDVYNFYEKIVMSGKDYYLNFLQNPFNGDIMNFLSRTVSCGNSSCLVLDSKNIPYLTSWEELSNEEYYHPGELFNEIFDIINF